MRSPAPNVKLGRFTSVLLVWIPPLLFFPLSSAQLAASGSFGDALHSSVMINMYSAAILVSLSVLASVADCVLQCPRSFIIGLIVVEFVLFFYFALLQFTSVSVSVSSRSNIGVANRSVAQQHYGQRFLQRRTTKQQITFVLLARAADAEGFPRLPGLLASLAFFAEASCIYELLLIVPDQDQTQFNDLVQGEGKQLFDALLKHSDTDGSAIRRFLDVWNKKRHSFLVRILSDSQVLPTPRAELRDLVPAGERRSNGGRGTNYRIQMLVKIGIANHVRTDFYVTLDCDVYAKRNFAYRDFVTSEGRARIQGESRDGYMTQHREGWWQAAEKSLDAEGCVKPGDPTIGVTPAILSTRASLAVMDRVVAVWSTSLGAGAWDLILFKLIQLDWTEYTLHFVGACQAKLLNEVFETNGDFSTPVLYGYDFFEFGSFDEERMRSEFGQGSIFGIVQSISGVEAAVVNMALVDVIAK